MQPVLNPNNNSDWVILNRWATRDFNIQRGEIVCLISPRNPDSRLIKRVIALEGDIVKTLNNSEGFIQIPEGHW
jgi:inner membrane protease subunit 2